MLTAIVANGAVLRSKAAVHIVFGITFLCTVASCTDAVNAQAGNEKPITDTPIGRQVFEDLAAYYEARETRNTISDVVPYVEMTRRLSSEDNVTRQQAGEYLLALCRQTEADDRFGRTPRPHGIKLHGGPNHYGAELRGWMATRLSRATFHQNGDEAFAVARWLYEHDAWPDHRLDAVIALARIRTPQADTLFAEMVGKPVGHFEILTIALEQSAERKLLPAALDIQTLCRHYHPDVRQAALAAALSLGLQGGGKYDPRADLGQQLEPWLRQLLTVLPDQVPADAKWCRFTIPADWLGFAGTEPERKEVCGWRIEDEGENYRIIDWTGQPRSWKRADTGVHPDTLSDFSQRIVELRERFNASSRNDEKSKLLETLGIYTFMMSSDARWDGSVQETLAAAWCLDRGDRQSCARLMIPLLTDASDEQLFLDHLRDDIAVVIDRRMLASFQTRDYGEALRLANSLSMPWFDGFVHQDRAKGLAKTLPDRGEDFQTLTLVSPRRWEALKRDFSRQRQIEYLAQRLKLIRTSQWSTPGGIAYSDSQYLEDDKVDSLEGEIEVINPHNELLRLNLTGEDMLLLVPYLQSADYILAYDLYRFMPQNPYRLHKVSWVVASVLNAASQQNLVDFAVLEGTPEQARTRQLEQIRQWCNEHARVTHADHLAKAVSNAEEWQDVRFAFWTLLELDEERAIPLIVSRCDRQEERTPELARLLCLLDRKDYLPRAQEWMRDEDDETRYWGSLLTLKHADPTQLNGLDIVLARLSKEIQTQSAYEAGQLLDTAIEALVVRDDPRVREFLSTYCGARPYREFDPSSATLQRLFLAGYKPALERILYHLADNTPAYEGADYPSSDDWLWRVNAWRYAEPPGYLDELPDEKRAEAYAEAKRWLTAQFQLVEEGKPTEMIKEDLTRPWGQWKTYSSGWVRRL